MKYTTKPIDFEGCDPIIAEYLKKGEMVLCEVGDTLNFEEMSYVYSYVQGDSYSYKTVDDIKQFINFKYARPIPQKTKRIMPQEKAIPILLADGYRLDECGDLRKHGLVVEVVTNRMIQLMGLPLYKLEMELPLNLLEVSTFCWPSCIIEEV